GIPSQANGLKLPVGIDVSAFSANVAGYGLKLPVDIEVSAFSADVAGSSLKDIGRQDHENWQQTITTESSRNMQDEVRNCNRTSVHTLEYRNWDGQQVLQVNVSSSFHRQNQNIDYRGSDVIRQDINSPPDPYNCTNDFYSPLLIRSEGQQQHRAQMFANSYSIDNLQAQICSIIVPPSMTSGKILMTGSTRNGKNNSEILVAMHRIDAIEFTTVHKQRLIFIYHYYIDYFHAILSQASMNADE
ncbi:5698_t:CDS:2, partial [Scutellospora calospora]